MLKKVYYGLRTLIWCLIGSFAGVSIFRYYDYKTHPDLYAWQSAPWYLQIEILAVLTGIAIILLLLFMLFLKRKIKSA